MGESFVDVSYRGLELGRRLKLRELRAESGYLEIPLPMPVGTRVEIATDEGLRFEALVTQVHEQIGGSDQQPGMRLAPKLSGASAQWWSDRVDRALPPIAPLAPISGNAPAPAPAPAPDPSPPKPPAVTDTPAAAMARPTMVMSTEAVKAALAAAGADDPDGLADDGRRTELMQVVVDPESESPLADDGKRTTVMDAIDVSMITGRASSQIGIATPDEEDTDTEIVIESDSESGDAESNGEVSGEIPTTPSGKVNGNGNGRKKPGAPKRRKKGAKR